MAQDQASLDCLTHPDEANEILKRLTVKNLCLMSNVMSNVSGTWKSLIYDADFKALHLAWSKKNPLMLIVTPPLLIQNYNFSDDEYAQAEQLHEDWGELDENLILYPLVFTSLNPAIGNVIYRQTINICADFEVLSSGRGCLFCIRSSLNYIIFNATTKEIQTLPEADPPYSNAAGFGYIESRNLYVLVILSYDSGQVLMLSENGEMLAPWRTIKGKPPFNISGTAGTIIRDTCYWMDDQQFRSSFTKYILCLNIDSDMFYKIDYPALKSYKNGHDMHMGELNNQLFLTDTCPQMLKMDIWVRENGENAKWDIKYRIGLSFILDGFDGDVFSQLKLIGYVGGDQDQDELLMFQDSDIYDQVVYYNVEAGSFRIGQQLQVEDNPGNMIFPYSERFNSIRRPQARRGSTA